MLCTARTVLSQDVRPSICVVTRCYCVETAKHILKQSSFSTPNVMAIFWRGPPNMGVECRGGRKKIAIFERISRFILEMIQDMAIVTVEGE